jgi:hypothetical protein
MLKQIQSEAAAGGDHSPFLDDMASNIRPLRRRLRLTKGRLVGRMTQERQKLSFFIVIMFLAIFGLIVLAEVGYQVIMIFLYLITYLFSKSQNIKNMYVSEVFLIFFSKISRTAKTQFLHCHYVSGHFRPHCLSRGRVSSKYSFLFTKSKNNCMFPAIL